VKDERICPSCGKPALPVATRCPKCGYAFETRYDRPHADSPRRVGLFGGLLLLVIVALLVANALRRHGGSRSGEPLHEAGMPAPAGSPSADTGSAGPVKTAQPAPVAVRAPPAPASAAKEAPRPPAPVTAAAPARPAPVALPPGGRRYATTWINVRSARSNRAPILKVLRPGEVVRIDSLDQGWYQVVTADQVQGYADHRLLSDAPPAPSP
jgi:SH3 domain-containing protein